MVIATYFGNGMHAGTCESGNLLQLERHPAWRLISSYSWLKFHWPREPDSRNVNSSIRSHPDILRLDARFGYRLWRDFEISFSEQSLQGRKQTTAASRCRVFGSLTWESGAL